MYFQQTTVFLGLWTIWTGVVMVTVGVVIARPVFLFSNHYHFYVFSWRIETLVMVWIFSISLGINFASVPIMIYIDFVWCCGCCVGLVGFGYGILQFRVGCCPLCRGGLSGIEGMGILNTALVGFFYFYFYFYY